MRIGIDCRLWSETGVGRYIRNLVLNLQELNKKNEYVLFVSSKDERNIKSAIRNPQFVIRLTDIRWHTIEEQLKFPQILNRENLDLMHFPYFSVPIFYSRPFIITIHDLIINHFPTGQASALPRPIYNFKLLAYKFVLGQAAKKAEKIIAVSDATRDEITDHLGINPQKIIVTYEGVDDKIRNSKSEIRNNLQNTKYKILNTKYYLYVGNAYPHKNLGRLLEALKILNSDVNLVLVGKKDYFYNRLKERVKNLDLDKKVIFFGEATDKELASLYSNALAFITPSLMEGFGLPALEAMANKCLVLASDIPALKEVCGDAAVYFDPYNVKDIAKKMNDVYPDDTYHYNDKKEKGLERVKFFSWQKMAEETLKVYNSVL